MKGYYKIESGVVLPILQKFTKDRNEIIASYRDWANQTPGVIDVSSRGVVTFAEGHEPGPAWRKHAPGKWKTNRRSKEGKKLALSLAALPLVPGSMDLLMRLMEVSECQEIMQVNSIGSVGFYHKAGTFMINCDEAWLPKDRTGIIEVTMGEFKAFAEPD